MVLIRDTLVSCVAIYFSNIVFFPLLGSSSYATSLLQKTNTSIVTDFFFFGKSKNPLQISFLLEKTSTNIGIHKTKWLKGNFRNHGIPSMLLYACGEYQVIIPHHITLYRSIILWLQHSNTCYFHKYHFLQLSGQQELFLP